MTKVHCTVNDCNYWAGQNVCTANEILVVGFPVPGQPDHHGRNAEQLPGTPVDRKDGTLCYTFEHT